MNICRDKVVDTYYISKAIYAQYIKTSTVVVKFLRSFYLDEACINVDVLSYTVRCEFLSRWGCEFIMQSLSFMLLC
jgi:hypothetical protein